MKNELIGKRIRLIEMFDDPQPVESGTMGTICKVDGMGHYMMKWDNGRGLSIIPDKDKFEIIEDYDLPPNNQLVFSGNI